MADLVRVDLDLLPTEPRYRPMSRLALLGRRFPIGLGIGMLAGIASVAVHTAVMWAALLAVFGYSIVRRRGVVQLARRNVDGRAMLMAGELHSAAATFESLCEASRGSPRLHSLVVCNRAAVFLEAGDPGRAVELLTAVLHAGWIDARGGLSSFYPSVLGTMAMAEALLDRPDRAQSWRARAHAATSSAQQGMHLLADVVVEARAGNDEEVVSMIGDRWKRAENLHSARQLRLIRLLEAFSLERLSSSSEYRGVSRETDAVRAVEAARASSPGDFRVLTENWPALAAFVQRHGLAAPG